MKFSIRWLYEWVKPNLTQQELLEQITLAGLEVDAATAVCNPFDGVVIGEIVACQPHPNADKLRITKVDVGQAELLQIVCGAANCRIGLKVACALENAKLADDFVIKKTKLRGELSQGMLCSWSELGINIAESSGIIELESTAPIGVDIRDYLQLDDSTIEIGLTPNRGDCLSIRGIARDVAALNNVKLIEKPIESYSPTTQIRQMIKVQEASACPCYLVRVIENINIQQPTPTFIIERLRRCGIRSIDPVVDITNYVMLEYGQPMHAFDHAKVGQQLIVRYAESGEKLILLDGSMITLQQETLVIANEHQVLALAGIFGGKESAVTAATRSIVLESAYFTPLAIAGKARAYGLHTDSSHRFERGVDPALSKEALEYATQLIVRYCGGEVGPICESISHEDLPVHHPILVRQTKIERLLGCTIPETSITQIFQQLGCAVDYDIIALQWSVIAPSWRFDLNIEEDYVEEVARIYGYANLPESPLAIELATQPQQNSDAKQDIAKSLLVSRGYSEVITYSFVNPKEQKVLHPTTEALSLPHPISSEMSAMRLSLWTGLLNTIQYNQNRQQQNLKLFEVGLRFLPDDMAPLKINQEWVLSGVVTGNRYTEHWSLPQRKIDFYDVKGDIEALFAAICPTKKLNFVTTKHAALHPGQAAAIYIEDQYIGHIGVIHPHVEKYFNLQEDIVLFELIWNNIPESVVANYQEISRYPANRRDISLLVEEHVAIQDLLDECEKVGGENLIDVNLFDVYRGENVAVGYKSVALSLILQDNTSTLEENQIINIVNKCVTALEVRFRVSLRD